WINSEREFLLWRQRLDGRIDEWNKNHRDRDALLQGPFLAEAEHWNGINATSLDSHESLFIRASIEARDNRVRTGRNRRRLLLASLCVGLAIAIALSATSILEWKEARNEAGLAEKNADVATARLMAARAREIAPNSPDTAALMALAGYRLSPT